jgi:methylphosphotriester-DNA--protein-cysteine methyltransferase
MMSQEESESMGGRTRYPKKRKQVSKACTECARQHVACTESRPCDRCKSNGRELLCQVSPRKEPVRKTKRSIQTGDETAATIDQLEAILHYEMAVHQQLKGQLENVCVDKIKEVLDMMREDSQGFR